MSQEQSPHTVSLLRTALGRSGNLIVQLEIFVQDLTLQKTCSFCCKLLYAKTRCKCFVSPDEMWPQLAGIHRNCITKKWLLEVGPFEHELPKLLKPARNTHHSFYLLSHPPHIVEGERQADTETKKEVERQKDKLCN